MNTINMCAVMLIILLILTMVIFILMIKNEVTYKQRIKIFAAIRSFSTFNGLTISAQDKLRDKVEPYNQTLLRIWDWGYKHIVPNDTFELIKDYIK